MFSLRRVWSPVLAAALVAGTAHAQLADPFAAPAVRVARATANQALSPASAEAPVEVVRAYLRTAGHAEATVASLQLAGSRVVQRTGVTHLRFIQRVGGLDVYGVYAKASVRANGEFSSVIENLVPTGAARTTSCTTASGARCRRTRSHTLASGRRTACRPRERRDSMTCRYRCYQGIS